MIPLIPALALAFFSFLCSAFVVLRIVIPILPPHPLSRRVAPSEFGLPNFRSLSPADKSHVWLASLDLLALAIFIWQAVSESTGGPTGPAIAQESLPTVRLWLMTTIRQTSLLVVAALTLLHVRLGRSVSFGKKHWMLWGPSAVLIITSTGVAAILSAAGLDSLFVGLAVYASTFAILSSAVFMGLVVTLAIIQRNLTSLNEDLDSWPPMRHAEDKPRPSFATEEIDAIRDGASWITSNASTRRDSVSAWSFTTHHTAGTSCHGGRAQSALHHSVPARSSYWFSSSTPQVDAIPPVPPLPSPYGPLSPTSESLAEPDPFRRIPTPVPHLPRERLGSQTSWLTSSNGSHATMSAWSFPATQAESIRNASSTNLHTALLPSTAVVSSRPGTPALSSAQVLGGYGYKDSEKGPAPSKASNSSLNISVYRTIGWLLLIWIPLGLSFPYLITLSQNVSVSPVASILFVLSMTMSSPILALNIILRSPIPIPSGLFDGPHDLPTDLLRGPSPTSSETVKWSHEYKRSASVTVVEGRRSGDVWLANGDATDGKSKVSRALGMMSPMPKLSVLPLEELDHDEPATPPLPIQDEDSSLPVNLHSRSYSETSAQFGRIRKDSKASSYFSGADESLAFASKIMIAQKHYSALAQTIHVNGGSPEKDASAGANLFLSGPVASTSATDFTSGTNNRASQHLRTRSVTSVSGPQTPTSGGSFGDSPSPPPSFPLPPTPPNVRAARLAKHKKSYSSISAGKFSFGPVDDMNEIDALTAGVLPLLVPGLTVGDDMKIRDSPPATWRRRARAELEISQERSTSRTRGEGKTARLLRALNEFGEDFSSPEMHSTPARTREGASKTREPRGRKTSAHKRNHFSLPSLGLGKDGIQSLNLWTNDVGRAIDNRFGHYTALPSNVDIRRNTVFGMDSVPNDLSNLRGTAEEPARSTKAVPLGRVMSTRSLGLRAEVPHGVDTARSSIASMMNRLPTSAASTITLFEEFVNGLESGPQAESTPHNSVAHKRVSEDVVPPLPSSSHFRTSTASNIDRSSNRRSSIVYIKSDETATVTPPNAPSTSTSAMNSLAQWSSRAVRPLMSKSTKLQRKASKVSPSAQSISKPDSPRGLRPLSLLQERDNNATAGPSVGTRPLHLGKKEGASPASSKKSRASDENTSPDAPRSRLNKHNLKPLNLARSDTSKMRAILRHDQLLPDVVVRPPSTTEHQAYAYSFRD